MSVFILALTAGVLSLLAGVGAFAASYLTAESEIMRPVREWLRNEATHHAWLDRVLKSHDLSDRATRRCRRIFTFAADLIACPFCTSWWHSAWIVPVTVCSLGGGIGLIAAVYLPTIGVCALAGRFRASKPAPAPVPIAHDLQDLLNQAQ